MLRRRLVLPGGGTAYSKAGTEQSCRVAQVTGVMRRHGHQAGRNGSLAEVYDLDLERKVVVARAREPDGRMLELA